MSMANSLLAEDFAVTSVVSSATGMVLARDLEWKGLWLASFHEVHHQIPRKGKKNHNDDKNANCHDNHVSPKDLSNL